MSKEELQKSKEQLEEEKQAILAQRIQPCVTEGEFNSQKKHIHLYIHIIHTHTHT